MWRHRITREGGLLMTGAFLYQGHSARTLGVVLALAISRDTDSSASCTILLQLSEACCVKANAWPSPLQQLTIIATPSSSYFVARWCR